MVFCAWILCLCRLCITLVFITAINSNLLENPIYINDYAFVSPIDDFVHQAKEVFFEKQVGDFVSPLSRKRELELTSLLEENTSYKTLDRSVQLAILAARGLKKVPSTSAINIGSSRGATGLWEDNHEKFIASGKKFAPTPTSPLTTLGNISSWVAQDLEITGAAFSHSITCATAAHSILNAIAWISSGMATDFIAGGSEAPLTPFTVAQMKALRIYATGNEDFPCRALDLDKKTNSMILGEAAACFSLSASDTNSLAKIIGYGTSIERLSSATSVSDAGLGLQESMRSALKSIDISTVDAIVTHAPGTIKGDLAEVAAIRAVFQNDLPVLCNNKWQIGHSLGASAAMNIVMALQMFEKETLVENPFYQTLKSSKKLNTAPKRVLINATGFGGNAVSLLVEKVE
jgi:3-oxoacyl-(acyl-carrier-protein) synthase